MNIQFNGDPHATRATTLDTLLSEVGLDASTVATAVNGNFVPKSLRAGHALTEGDQVEVLAPMQGG